MADADLKSELRGTPTGELGSRLQRLSLRESSLKRFFSNFRDFLVERPVKLRGSDGPAPFVDEQFGGGFWDNLRESFRSVPRSAQNVHSGLLVEWKPGLGVFIQNLRDSLFPRKLPPLNVTSKPIAVPEIWSKNEQFKSVQALSIAVHAVVAALIIVPIWRGIMTPPTTQASNVVITTISDYSPTLAKLPPGKDKAGGGGGGGERNPVPASKGRAPKFSWTQIAPPSARTPDHAQILVQPNLLGPPDLKLQNNNMPNWGDPFAKSVTTSNGPGSGGGMGSGTGTGIGSGNGGGLGPGEGFGTGGGYPSAGSGGYGMPECAYCPSPPFSDEAVKAKYQGTVLIQAVIKPDGTASNIQVIKGLGLGLDEKAIEAVRNWRFIPARGPNGQASAVVAQIEVTFRLL